MSTNGLYGFMKDGKLKITYNHFDSYPECLGKEIFNYIKNRTLSDLIKIYDSIELIDGDKKPTKEQKKKYELCSDVSVSRQSLNDWYCLLRNLQGDLFGHESYGVMIDYSMSFHEGYFPWAYVINIDNKSFDIYTNMYDTESGQYKFGIVLSLKLNRLPKVFPVNKIFKEMEKNHRKDPDNEV